MLPVTNDFKYRIVFWNLDSRDGLYGATADTIVQQYTSALRNPDQQSFIAVNSAASSLGLSALPRILTSIRNRGFVQVPLYLCLNEPAYNTVE
jgi:peptidoglycan/xylan/chitin deacetylase (PgdA/CDA1 family)